MGFVASVTSTGGLTVSFGRQNVPLDSAVKKQIMTEYGTSEGDTGSPEVQVALLTQRINDLTEHLKTHKHCCCSSANAVACCSTWPRRTSRATASSLSDWVCAAKLSGAVLPLIH